MATIGKGFEVPPKEYWAKFPGWEALQADLEQVPRVKALIQCLSTAYLLDGESPAESVCCLAGDV